MGITAHAQEQLRDIVFVELPSLGKELKAGEACAVVESVKAAYDIFSPLSGKVIKINEFVEENSNRLADSSLQLFEGGGELIFPSVYDGNCCFVVSFRHNVKHIIFC